jgi:hypothetical protein
MCNTSFAPVPAPCVRLRIESYSFNQTAPNFEVGDTTTYGVIQTDSDGHELQLGIRAGCGPELCRQRQRHLPQRH